MKKIKENLKKIEFYKKSEFWIFTFITILFFGILYRMEYATDTYCVFTDNKIETITVFMRAGRFLTAFMFKMLFMLNCKQVFIYFVSFLIAVFSIIISMYKLYKIISKDIENNAIRIIISILIILNIFSIELMLFLEKGIMALSILFNVLAIEQLIKVFNGNKKSIIFSFIYMLLANCSYQGTVALFVVVSMAYILKNSKNIKDFIYKNTLTALLYGIPAGINYIFSRFIFGSSRVTGQVKLIESIKVIIINILRIIKNTCQVMPKWFFAGFLGCIIFIIIYMAFKQKNKIKDRVFYISGIFYIILGTIVTCIMPQLLQNTESIWMVPRTMYALGSLIGVMILFLCMNFKIENLLEKVLIILSIFYIGTQYINFQKIIVDRYILNYQDKSIAISIKNKIDQYESNGGNKVEKIVICNDKEVMYTYPGILATGDMNIKAFLQDWSMIALIKYYTGRDFEIVEKDLTIQNHFDEKNWNTYESEQIIIQDDTIYICVF